MRIVLSLVLASLLIPSALPAAKKEMTRLNLLVLDEDGEPVPRASIVVRTLKGKKHKKIGETFQLKTSLQGTAPLPPVKQGYILIQVIAEGFQTFGDKIELREPEQDLTITLKPPREQLSVHP